MMPRYFVTVQIPQATVELVKTYFREKFQREMTANHVHMSLLPPFFLNENQTETELLRIISKTSPNPFEAKFTGVRSSEQRMRKFLFLKVGPEDKCKELSLFVEKRISHMISVDKKPYINEEVPQFEAHVTIDYNFSGDVPTNFPEISFNVDKISVAKEVNGEWVDLALE